jgi:hypothetical protein
MTSLLLMNDRVGLLQGTQPTGRDCRMVAAVPENRVTLGLIERCGKPYSNSPCSLQPAVSRHWLHNVDVLFPAAVPRLSLQVSPLTRFGRKDFITIDGFNVFCGVGCR